MNQQKNFIKNNFNLRSEILKGMVEIFWGSAWVDHVEDVKCQNLSGAEITEVMPEPPKYAYKLAKKALKKLVKANSNFKIEILYQKALRNIPKNKKSLAKNSSPIRFGNCLALRNAWNRDFMDG
jgi:hypothetical protein